jgi:GH24 family phage-related lysozyme (muramidase)
VEPDWDKARELIIDEEGFIPFAYDDAGIWPRQPVAREACRLVGNQYKVNATGGTVTVGFGETRADLVDRHWDSITREEAIAIFNGRMREFWEAGRQYFSVELNPNQGAAAVSFFYNAGPHAMKTQAPELLAAINQRRWADAAELWKTAVLKRPKFDLSARRRAESNLFSEPWAGDIWDVLFVPVLMG